MSKARIFVVDEPADFDGRHLFSGSVHAPFAKDGILLLKEPNVRYSYARAFVLDVRRAPYIEKHAGRRFRYILDISPIVPDRIELPQVFAQFQEVEL